MRCLVLLSRCGSSSKTCSQLSNEGKSAVSLINFWPAAFQRAKPRRCLFIISSHTHGTSQGAIPNCLIPAGVSFSTPLTPAALTGSHTKLLNSSWCLFLYSSHTCWTLAESHTKLLDSSRCLFLHSSCTPEPVLLNVYGAPELIPRNEFRQPM